MPSRFLFGALALVVALSSAHAQLDRVQPAPLSQSTVYFGRGSDKLDSEARGHLDELVGWLDDNPRRRLQLVGHADEPGGVELNKRLGLARAESVKLALVDRGVDPARIRVMSRGELEAEGGANPEERRVVFFATAPEPRATLDYPKSLVERPQTLPADVLEGTGYVAYSPGGEMFIVGVDTGYGFTGSLAAGVGLSRAWGADDSSTTLSPHASVTAEVYR